MQIKIFLIGILVGCSYLIGEYIYKSYINRNRQINDLIRVLEIMRMDLSFGLYTLEEIFSRIGEKKEFQFYRFFKSMEYELKNYPGKTLEDILEASSETLHKDTYLQKKEVDEVKKLILTLGKSDITSQQRIIDLSVENLKKLTSETTEDINKKGILYKKLITFIGIGLGIILI